MKSEWQIRQDICEIGRRLYARNLVVATDGNISVRLPGDVIILTPAGAAKGELQPQDLIKIDLQGHKISGSGRPSSETPMHLTVYQERPDVRAVLHAHPPYAVAFTVAGISLAQCVLPEVVLTIGQILTTQYATPTTEQDAQVVRELLGQSDALLLDRHGSLTVGRDLWDAYHKLERLEHAAKITLFARQLGHVKLLPPEEIQALLARRAQLGLPANSECNGCGSCLGTPSNIPDRA